MATFKPANLNSFKRTNKFEYVCPKCKEITIIYFFSKDGKKWLYNVDSKEGMESVKETFKTFICPHCKKIKK